MNGTQMDRLEETTHSFIVKIWLEKRAKASTRAIWRGHITHVPGGERRHIKHLEDIGQFIAPYLTSLGVELGGGWRVLAWLHRLRRHHRTKL
jgi:hypothetical protein